MNNNKLNKILGIVTALAGSVLLIAVGVLIFRGSRFSDIFDFSDLFRTAAPTTSASADPTVPYAETTSAESQSESPTKESTAPTVTEPPEIRYSTKLRVGVSQLKGQFDPFAELSEGDENVMKLVGINLLTRDRAGKVIRMATEGEYSYYNNERYLYTGPADITVDYNENTNETTYTLKLKDGIFFSDGVKLTVDDLIFNLYVRLQPNFTGEGSLRSFDIVGLKNYYYNNSLAESIEISDEEIAAELENPCEEVSDYIYTLISDTLWAEARQSQEIWSTYAALGYGNNAQEYFYNIYGLDMTYSLKYKNGEDLVYRSLDEVCQYVIDSYGLNYRLLAENYAVNASYFDNQVNAFTRETLLLKKMKEEGGEPVDYISGIVRLGEYSVKLRMHGQPSEELYELFDMVIAPLHYYGDPLLYDYESHQFGFPRGNYTLPEKAVNAPLGAGPYVFVSYDGEKVYLKKNEKYYKQTSDIDYLTIQVYQENVTEQIVNDELDIVVLDGNRRTNETLCSANSNGTLRGDHLYVEEIPDLGYCYIGINADRVKVGEDASSQASVMLRKGLLSAISAFKDLAYREYFGSSVAIIEYPASPFFALTPEKSEYETAYCRDASGSVFFRNTDDVMSRYNAAVEAVKGFFLAAGYEYNENTGKFTDAPEGASLRYEIMLNGSIQEEHPSYGVLAYAKAALAQMGITLDIRYVNSVESMLVYLFQKESDLWCASWNCIGSPNFDLHYNSGAETNLYNLADPELDKMIEEYNLLNESEDQAGAAEKAKMIMNRVREWAVELPCYTLLDYLVYNVNSIDVKTLPTGHSLYWTWMDDVAFLDVYPKVAEE